MADAQDQNKALLVSYGAEWCIWCHVFEAYVNGETSEFTHTFSDPDDVERHTVTLYEREKQDMSRAAEALNRFVANNFVLVHIDTRYATGGDKVLEAAGINPWDITGFPTIYSVAADGSLAMYHDHERVEVRRDGLLSWFRGYDRVELLQELTEMRDAAR